MHATISGNLGYEVFVFALIVTDFYIVYIFVFISRKNSPKFQDGYKNILSNYPNIFHSLELKIAKASWKKSRALNINVTGVSIYC